MTFDVWTFSLTLIRCEHGRKRRQRLMSTCGRRREYSNGVFLQVCREYSLQTVEYATGSDSWRAGAGDALSRTSVRAKGGLDDLRPRSQGEEGHAEIPFEVANKAA